MLSQGQKSKLKSDFTPACSPVPVGSQNYILFYLIWDEKMEEKTTGTIDFFGLQLEIASDGTLYAVRYGGITLNDSISDSILRVYQAYQAQTQKIKSLRKRHKNLIKTFEQAQKTRAQTKDNYLKTIAVHQETANHYKRTVRAF